MRTQSRPVFRDTTNIIWNYTQSRQYLDKTQIKASQLWAWVKIWRGLAFQKGISTKIFSTKKGNFIKPLQTIHLIALRQNIAGLLQVFVLFLSSIYTHTPQAATTKVAIFNRNDPALTFYSTYPRQMNNKSIIYWLNVSDLSKIQSKFLF